MTDRTPEFFATVSSDDPGALRQLVREIDKLPPERRIRYAGNTRLESVTFEEESLNEDVKRILSRLEERGFRFTVHH